MINKCKRSISPNSNKKEMFPLDSFSSYQNKFQLKVNKVNDDIEKQLINLEEEIALIKRTKKVKESVEKNDSCLRKIINIEGQEKILKQSALSMHRFPKEFGELINNIIQQIFFDANLTEMVMIIDPTIIKSTLKYYSEIDPTLFEVSFVEKDPINIIAPASKEESEKIMRRAAILYHENEDNFKSRLRHKFSKDIVALFFEEFVSHGESSTREASANVGSLVSYVNAWSNKAFRNRHYVKFLRRLNLRWDVELKIANFVNILGY